MSREGTIYRTHPDTLSALRTPRGPIPSINLSLSPYINDTDPADFRKAQRPAS